MALDTDWRLFDYDLATGKAVWTRFEGDQLKVRTVMPVDDLVGENAAMRAEKQGATWGDGLELVARVPMHIWQRELADQIQQDDKAVVSRWLNDPDHRAFRARDGKV